MKRNYLYLLQFKLLKFLEKKMSLDYQRRDLKISVTSRAEYFYRTASCTREPNTVKWIENIDEHSIFFDIGANIGAYSLIAASQKNIDKVFSFEPFYTNFFKLSSNIILNKLSNKITPVNLALHDKTEISRLNHWDAYSLGEAGSSGHQINTAITEAGHSFEPVAISYVLAITLDDFCASYKIKPTAIKIDVDGNELSILSGAIETLKSDDLKTALIEVNRDNEAAIDDIMLSAGFSKTTTNEHNNIIYIKHIQQPQLTD
uniref:FkbM family methyltransferase n=1 Tax=Polynucleobacter sp. TaxID=2029855 RepID=UPI00404742D7